jgi:uroporphyrinogen-III synthase
LLITLKKRRVVAIGPNTEKELIKIGIENSFLPGDYSSEGIVEALCPEVKGKIVDLARSSFGAKLLIEGLEKCGATVFDTHVYTLSIPEEAVQKALIECTLAGEVDAFAFTSSMMVKGFMRHAERLGAGDTIKENLNRTIVGAIGIPTGDTLKKYGIVPWHINRMYYFLKDAFIIQIHAAKARLNPPYTKNIRISISVNIVNCHSPFFIWSYRQADVFVFNNLKSGDFLRKNIKCADRRNN